MAFITGPEPEQREEAAPHPLPPGTLAAAAREEAGFTATFAAQGPRARNDDKGPRAGEAAASGLRSRYPVTPLHKFYRRDSPHGPFAQQTFL